MRDRLGGINSARCRHWKIEIGHAHCAPVDADDAGTVFGVADNALGAFVFKAITRAGRVITGRRLGFCGGHATRPNCKSDEGVFSGARKVRGSRFGRASPQARFLVAMAPGRLHGANGIPTHAPSFVAYGSRRRRYRRLGLRQQGGLSLG